MSEILNEAPEPTSLSVTITMHFLFFIALMGSAFAADPAIREVTKKTYEAGIATNAVVVFDVNWGRHWNCGGYENAELMKLEFDRVTGEPKAPNGKADFIVEGPSRLTRTLRFLNYAFILPPGEYVLSGVSIKVARSMRDVGYLNTKQSDLIREGKPEGGSFTVAAGEIVFIGNFFLDCQPEPILWRYYPENKVDFQNQVAEYRTKYPFLDEDRFRFRLFRSKYFGTDYELPK
jgi:hypothetical protein